MAEQNQYSEFIDADAGFTNEKNSYEELILRQMNECVKVLSREMTGGQVIYKQGVSGNEKYIEDVRELVINHIDALKMLMTTYVKKENKKQLDTILEEIKKKKEEILGSKIIIRGRGQIKLGDLKGVHVDNPMWKEFIHFKALRYREIFEILVSAYNDQKAYIRSLEEE